MLMLMVVKYAASHMAASSAGFLKCEYPKIIFTITKCIYIPVLMWVSLVPFLVCTSTQLKVTESQALSAS